MNHFRGTYSLARQLSTAHLAHCASMFAHHTPDRWKALRLTEITQAMIVQRHRDITASGGSRRATTGWR